jgi:lipopolysaccharide/colanic/teichoic acid biosynthesis glycosyltransferase
MERRVERDLWYVDNWSMALDLKILAATVCIAARFDAASRPAAARNHT